MSSWKRIVLIGFAAGAGLAVTLVLLAAIFLWYHSHPKAWKKDAIKATFNYIDTDKSGQTIYFFYTLENASDTDYRLSDFSKTSLMLKLQRENTLYPATQIELVYPVFVPARQRVGILLKTEDIPYKKRRRPSKGAEDYPEELSKHVSEEWPNVDGFVLLDESNRYQIYLPKGW